MLVYRVDGSEINPAGCVDSADGEYPGIASSVLLITMQLF